jgi:hypothetical protein
VYMLLQSSPTPRLARCDRVTVNLHVFHHTRYLIVDTAPESWTKPETEQTPAPPSCPSLGCN